MIDGMRHASFNIPEEQLADFCHRHKVANLSLFGSHLHGDARPDSDIDLLVQFLPDANPSLFDFGGMIMELREILGRDVDLRTPEDLSPYFRNHVLREARLLYAA
jgi:predicted nucleotidyltransferase